MVAHGVAVSCALKDSEPSLAGDRQFDMTRNGADAARNSENRRRRAIVNNCNLKPNAEHDPLTLTVQRTSFPRARRSSSTDTRTNSVAVINPYSTTV